MAFSFFWFCLVDIFFPIEDAVPFACWEGDWRLEGWG